MNIDPEIEIIGLQAETNRRIRVNMSASEAYEVTQIQGHLHCAQLILSNPVTAPWMYTSIDEARKHLRNLVRMQGS